MECQWTDWSLKQIKVFEQSRIKTKSIKAPLHTKISHNQLGVLSAADNCFASKLPTFPIKPGSKSIVDTLHQELCAVHLVPADAFQCINKATPGEVWCTQSLLSASAPKPFSPAFVFYERSTKQPLCNFNTCLKMVRSDTCDYFRPEQRSVHRTFQYFLNFLFLGGIRG